MRENFRVTGQKRFWRWIRGPFLQEYHSWSFILNHKKKKKNIREHPLPPSISCFSLRDGSGWLDLHTEFYYRRASPKLQSAFQTHIARCITCRNKGKIFLADYSLNQKSHTSDCSAASLGLLREALHLPHPCLHTLECLPLSAVVLQGLTASLTQSSCGGCGGFPGGGGVDQG